MKIPDVVVIGHVVQDIVADGWRLGGTATFAAVQAQRLGLQVGLVTRVGPDVVIGDMLPSDLTVAGRPSTCTTKFENVYDGAQRQQRVPARAEPVSAHDDVPAGWRRAPVVLLGPVCGELSADLGANFPDSFVGVSAQGWLRSVDEDQRVQSRVWEGSPFWSDCEALFVSDEDLGGDDGQLARWTADVPMVVVTRNRRGARLHMDGRWQHIENFPAREVDPTGAGDVFASAFLVRYHETKDAAESMRFASAAAACSIEQPGIEGVAGREAIEARMMSHPEVMLR